MIILREVEKEKKYYENYYYRIEPNRRKRL
jgi:hypothetical protein